jgi:hypothetical protein
MRQTGRLVAMLFLLPTSTVLANGFSGGIGDTFGPRFKTDSNRAPCGPIDLRHRPRSLVERRFFSLSQAEKENAQSRIYLGIHWSFDKTEGIAQGRQVADYVYANAFAPRRRRGR